MSWKAEYVVLIIVSTLIDYIAGQQIYTAKTNRKKKLFLSLSIFTNIGLLFAFKYFNFFSDSFRKLLSLLTIDMNSITLRVLLPIGISFYTFQTISYTIDIYRGKIKPEKHLGIFAVYVAFFPQLVAGPIERAKNLLPQFFEKHNFNYHQATNGLKLMIWGFFKKLVIADKLAIIVNVVYGNVGDYTGIALILATVFFAFQIYCDFSGYSDIAIGCAQIMGYRLTRNFNRPYFAKSIPEFWRRWHISLTTWFKDYIYIPLGGNRVSTHRWHTNILMVFLVSGLWHGANWTFIVWGALHGLYMVLFNITHKIRSTLARLARLEKIPRIHTFFKIIFTFILVNIGWVFFRADSLSDAIYILTNSLSGLSFEIKKLGISTGYLGLVYYLAILGLLIGVQLLQTRISITKFLSKKPLIIRWGIYIVILLGILFFGQYGDSQFIYFQF
jgi:D-alanyl-lipoteichoic acid acyltransferase DltB (MBOAT superfamily)